MDIDVSVVIPTFRRPQELRAAISSVLCQRNVAVEIIVVDDSPEASAREVIASLDDRRVRYLKNADPTGGIPSIVRNKGWPDARGTFVHFLDDDDVVPQGHYSVVRDTFARHPHVGLVFGRIEPFGNCPPEQLADERRYFARAARKALICQRFGPKWGFTAQMLFGRALLVCSASILRRRCIADVGGFDPAIRLMEDADFHIRVMRKCGAHFMDRVSVQYRIGSASLMHSPNPSARQLEYERDGRRRIKVKYRKERGELEFVALALLSRTLLRGP